MRVLVPAALVLGVLIVVAPTGGASDGGTVRAAHESCVPRNSSDKGHRTTHARAKRVVERYARETLDRCDGVEGMGVGAKTAEDRPPRSEEKVHHIAVFLRDSESKPPHTRSIAGVRIVFVVTGEFRPQ